MASSSTALVDILTTDYGLLSGEATGLPGPIQAARVVVTRNGESRSHVVVRAAAPPWQLPVDDRLIRRVFPRDVLTCIRTETPGAATVSSSCDDDATMFAAAAATATLMRSWGWDESPSIVIDFLTNAASFDVNPIFKGGVWQVNPT